MTSIPGACPRGGASEKFAYRGKLREKIGKEGKKIKRKKKGKENQYFGK